jgi:hypothetical protein
MVRGRVIVVVVVVVVVIAITIIINTAIVAGYGRRSE